jgi:prepilin-type N-terminal cleavage/methylation domain-containing protein
VDTKGVTLLEMLIVLAIAGILLAIGTYQLRPPSARLVANALKTQLLQAKLESIKRNRPVAVLYNAAQQRFITTAKSSIPWTDATLQDYPCSLTDSVLYTLDLREYPATKVLAAFKAVGGAQGVVWNPNGRPSFCDGSTLAIDNTSLDNRASIQNNRTNLNVRVTSAGQVMVQ